MKGSVEFLTLNVFPLYDGEKECSVGYIIKFPPYWRGKRVVVHSFSHSVRWGETVGGTLFLPICTVEWNSGGTLFLSFHKKEAKSGEYIYSLLEMTP